MAIVIEGTDAAANKTTAYSIEVGDEFRGFNNSSYDKDWVAITLTEGVHYEVFADPSGTVPASYPDVKLYDSNGTLIPRTERGSSTSEHYSYLTFSVSSTGTYFIQCSDEISYSSGQYTMKVLERDSIVTPQPLREFTDQEIADQLTNGYWESDGHNRQAFDISVNQTITVDIGNLTNKGKKLARAALDQWEAVTGLTFRKVSSNANIKFDDEKNDAFTKNDVTGDFITRAKINIDKDWISGNPGYGADVEGYAYSTYLHEIGHALGLGHAGNYNENATFKKNGKGDNHYLNDSWQKTVMSYFSQADNTHIDASFGGVITPMIADILAIQSLYANAVPTANAGDTTFDLAGRNTPIQTSGLTSNGNAYVMTLFDTGGIDTFDTSDSTEPQLVDMRPGHDSDVNGSTDNVSIAWGTIIEKFKGGSEFDLVTGNSADNRIYGNKGEDEIEGRGGADTLFGGQGRDKLFGGDGVDRLSGGADKDRLEGGAKKDILKGGSGDDTLIGGGGNDKMRGNADSDKMRGDAGDDTILGDGGNDTLLGGADNDILVPGTGKDRMKGNSGADHFVFAKHEDANFIADFENGVDLIDLKAFGYSRVKAALKKFYDVGNDHDQIIGFKHKGTLINVKGLDMDDLNGADLLI